MARTPITSLEDLEKEPIKKSLILNTDKVVELRRIDIIRRRLRGETIAVIADSLGCSVSTINNDIKAIRESNQSWVKEFDQGSYIGDTLQTFKKIEEEAWFQVFSLDIGDSRKAKFLDSIRATRKEAIKLLQSSGLLHKEAQKVEVQISANVIDNWSSDQKMLVADALVEAAIIDVEHEPVVEEFNSLPLKSESLELDDIAEFLDD